MAIVLPIHFFRRRAQSGTKASHEPVGSLPQSIYLLIPAAFDLVVTCCLNVSLLWLPASVWSMLLGSTIVFGAVLSVVFLRRPHFGFHWFGVGLATLGVVCVSTATLADGGAQDTRGVSVELTFCGVGLALFASVLMSAQVIMEERLLKDAGFDPYFVVGFEGLFGLALAVVIIYPCVWLIPGPDAEHLEDLLDTLIMVWNNVWIQFVLVLYVIATSGYNVVGMFCTSVLTGVHRLMMEAFRTLFVWSFFLLWHYCVDSDAKFGERWTPWSCLQVFGFVLLGLGQATYGMHIQWPGLWYPLDEPGKHVRPRQDQSGEIALENREGLVRVGVLFGGCSGEHEVSIRSARTVVRGLRGGANSERYCVVPIYIDRSGHWQGGTVAQALLNGAAPVPVSSKAVCWSFPPEASGVDVWFPVLHGPNGEDGTVQGLLTMLGQRFVGSGVLGSAVGMDKLAMKAAFAAAGAPQGPYAAVMACELDDLPGLCARLEASMGYPCFVKPANMGSSVGVSKAHDQNELEAALRLATSLDQRVVVEQGLEVRELECAVLGSAVSLEASVVGEVLFDAEWYDYETKYTEGRSSVQIPAHIPSELEDRIRMLAKAAVQAVGASGISRVDFFYEKGTGRLLLNEINTMPGFTSQSMYPMLWEASGLPLEDLVHRLVGLAWQGDPKSA